MLIDNDAGYMMCICGQWVVGYHRACLALLPPNFGPEKRIDEEEVAGDYDKP